jgi:hypothetical protein
MAPRDQDGTGGGLFAGWRDAGADPTKPNIARVYDYWLGGRRNLVADRELAEAMATLDPWVPAACKANRAFLRRAVRFLAAQGIRQFLDIGSGLPTEGNVHQIAQQAAPEARVVYVDRDPVAVAEGRKLVGGNDRVTVVQADLRDPAKILLDPEVTKLIDFAQPAGVLLVAVLHFVLDADDPHGIITYLRDAAAAGSYLVISHVAGDGRAALTAAAERVYTSRGADGQARTREQIAGFFGGWELAGPGLVYAPLWRPDPGDDMPEHPERFWFLAGVARKPPEKP